MKTPDSYFLDGYQAASRDLPASSCPLLFNAWPREAWIKGHRFYGQFVLKQREPEPAKLERVPSNVWEQGANANRKGISIDDCPYEPGSGDSMIWQAGWISVQPETPMPPIWGAVLPSALVLALVIIGALLWAFGNY